MIQFKLVLYRQHKARTKNIHTSVSGITTQQLVAVCYSLFIVYSLFAQKFLNNCFNRISVFKIQTKFFIVQCQFKTTLFICLMRRKYFKTALPQAVGCSTRNRNGCHFYPCKFSHLYQQISTRTRQLCQSWHHVTAMQMTYSLKLDWK